MLKENYKKAIIGLCLIAALVFIYLSFNVVVDGNHRSLAPKRIALLLNTHAGQHGIVVKQGALLAAKENKAELTVYTPYFDLDVEAFQLSRIDEIIAEKYDGVLLMSCNSDKMPDAIRRMELAGIDVILLDVPIKGAGGKYLSHYVGTNHRLSGKILMESLLVNEQQPISILLIDNGLAVSLVNQERIIGIYEGLNNTKMGVRINRLSFSDMDSLKNELINSEASAVISMDSILTENIAHIKDSYNKKFNIYGFDSNQMHINLMYKDLVEQELIRDSLAIGYRGLNSLLSKISGFSLADVDYIKAHLVNSNLLKYNKYASLLYPISVE